MAIRSDPAGTIKLLAMGLSFAMVVGGGYVIYARSKG
jgi:hypothetical protein